MLRNPGDRKAVPLPFSFLPGNLNGRGNRLPRTLPTAHTSPPRHPHLPRPLWRRSTDATRRLNSRLAVPLSDASLMNFVIPAERICHVFIRTGPYEDVRNGGVSLMNNETIFLRPDVIIKSRYVACLIY